ncbi:hypothetical protein DPX16_20701 [Anabarilius grahami]|uniref:Uncharacterized protein n=1 Tax=Anabarilius grahami TaxID=495550 RepID=A0A3N0YLI6_ANAGA|nr:hypothetical protein DPX16_20701 [Anabarilius grahami]
MLPSEDGRKALRQVRIQSHKHMYNPTTLHITSHIHHMKAARWMGVSWMNPLLSLALHASFYAKRHIREKQRMGRALTMRGDGRKLVCQFPQYAIQDFQRHQRKLSTLQSHIHSPAFRGHGHTAKCLMKATPSRIDKAARSTEQPFGNY